MKHTMLTLLLLVICSVSVTAQNVLVGEGSSLSAQLLRYQPNPAEPGDVVEVWLLINNDGGGTARNVTVELVDNFPFTITDPTSRLKSMASIPARESQLVRYTVRVHKDADEGTAYLKVRYGARGAIREELVQLDILTLDAFIAIESIEMTPSQVRPGDKTEIVLHLRNLADSRVRNIAVKLATTRVVGSDTTALPFAPIGQSLEQRISELAGGEAFEVKYSLIAEPDAASDVYTLPLTITFQDETGNNYTIADSIGMVVNAPPMFDAYFDSVDLYADKPTGEVTMRFVNRGLSEIKLLRIKILPDDSFELRSTSDVIYIGNIDSDDYETETVSIKANGDQLTMPVDIEYLDTLNAPHSAKVLLKADLMSQREAGIGNGNSGTMIVVILVVAVIAILILRHWRKKNRKKRAD